MAKTNNTEPETMIDPTPETTATDLIRHNGYRHQRYARNATDSAVAQWEDNQWRVIAAKTIDGRWRSASPVMASGIDPFAPWTEVDKPGSLTATQTATNGETADC